MSRKEHFTLTVKEGVTGKAWRKIRLGYGDRKDSRQKELHVERIMDQQHICLEEGDNGETLGRQELGFQNHIRNYEIFLFF